MARPGIDVALDGHAELGVVGRQHFRDRRHHVHDRRLPAELPEVGLIHEVVPFPAGQFVIVVIAHRPVLAEELAHARGQGVGAGPSLLGKQEIASRLDVHLRDQRRGLRRVEHELIKRVPLLRRQHRGKFPGPLRDVAPGGLDALGLAVVELAEGLRLDDFRLPPAVVFRVAGDEIGDLSGMLRAEIALGPATGVVGHLVLGQGGGVPRQAQEEFDRQLERLQVADVDDPDAGRAVFVCEVHLLGDLRKRVGVDPLVGERPAMHVEVVIDAGAAAALALVEGRQAPEVAGVVVRPEQRHVFRRAQPTLVVPLYLREERPELRDLRGIGPHFFGQDPALVGEDAFEQLHVGLDTAGADHGLVAVAPHPDRDQVFVILVARNALAEEPLQGPGVGGIVPLAVAVLLAPTGPLLVRAHHRLMVGGAHDDAVLIGQTRIVRIVLVEGVVPHRRPEVVGPQAQEQLEDLRIEPRVQPAELLLGPTGQARSLVVEEDAAILHGRRPLDKGAGLEEDRLPVLRRHIGPPIPGRHADLLGDFVQTVDRTPLVATDDHQGPGDAGQRLVDRGDRERLPFPGEAGGRHLARPHQPINQQAMAQRAGDDDRLAAGRLACDQHGEHTAHAFDVRTQVRRGALHAGVIRRVDEHRRGPPVRHQRESSAIGSFQQEVLGQTETRAGGGYDRDTGQQPGGGQ